MKRALAAILAACLLLVAPPGGADEIRPAFLQLTETGTDTYRAYWKVPARSESLRLALKVNFDDSVEALSEPQGGYVDGADIRQWRLRREGGLAGASLSIDGLQRMNTEVLLRVENLDGTSILHRLTPAAPDYVIADHPSLGQVVWSYLVLGVEHILIGLDHLLFVLVLMLLVRGVRQLIATITAFTVAHSITLSLAALDVVSIPIPPVEAVIALSIVFVASEIIHTQEGRPGLTQRKPWIVAFTFGLLHGLGFAAALGEIGMPQTAVPAALLFFNIGVELGQLIFVAAVLLVMGLLRKLPFKPPEWTRLVAPYAIGSMASFWVAERVAGFWS